MYEIDVEHGSDFSRFTVRGSQSLETEVAIDAEIVRECVDHGSIVALVDIRGLEGRLSIADNHAVAQTARTRMGHVLRHVAVIDLPDHRAESEMYELVAFNRGASIRFFLRVDEAEQWLRETAVDP